MSQGPEKHYIQEERKAKQGRNIAAYQFEVLNAADEVGCVRPTALDVHAILKGWGTKKGRMSQPWVKVTEESHQRDTEGQRAATNHGLDRHTHARRHAGIRNRCLRFFRRAKAMQKTSRPFSKLARYVFHVQVIPSKLRGDIPDEKMTLPLSFPP